MNPLAKEISLAITSGLLSILMFFGLAYILQDLAQYSPLFIALVPLVVIWLVVTTISLYLISRWDLVGLIILAAGAAAIVGGGLTNWGAIGGGLLLCLLSAGAAQSFKRDASNLRQYRTTAIFAGGGRLLLTGVILAAAGMSLPVIQGSIKQEGIELKPEHVEFVMRPLAPILQDITPNVKMTDNIDSVIDNQLRQQGINPASVPPDQRAALKSQVSQQFQVEVTGEESIATIATSRLNKAIARLVQVHALTIALVAVVLAFLTIRAVVPILNWLLLVFIAVAMWFAKSIGFVVVVREPVQVDKVTL